LFTHGGYIKCYTICAFMLNHIYYNVYHNWSLYMSLLIYYSQVLMNTRMFTLLWINKYRMYNNIIPQIFHFIWIFLICFHNCSFAIEEREREGELKIRTDVRIACSGCNKHRENISDRYGPNSPNYYSFVKLPWSRETAIN
jgi:hypothetical protein